VKRRSKFDLRVEQLDFLGPMLTIVETVYMQITFINGHFPTIKLNGKAAKSY
jgi:hypothetical protein